MLFALECYIIIHRYSHVICNKCVTVLLWRFFLGDILFKREERHNLSGRGGVMDWCEQREVHGRVKLFFQLARGKPCRYYAILFKKQMLQMFYVIFLDFTMILWLEDLIFNIFWILPWGGAVYSYVIDPSWCVCYEQMQMRHQWHPFYFSFSTREYMRPANCYWTSAAAVCGLSSAWDPCRHHCVMRFAPHSLTN